MDPSQRATAREAHFMTAAKAEYNLSAVVSSLALQRSTVDIIRCFVKYVYIEKVLMCNLHSWFFKPSHAVQQKSVLAE